MAFRIATIPRSRASAISSKWRSPARSLQPSTMRLRSSRVSSGAWSRVQGSFRAGPNWSRLVAHAPFPAGDVERHALAHERHARPRTVDQRGVYVLRGRLAVGDHMERFAPQGLLQARGDKARDFLLHDQRRLARRGVELSHPVDRLRCRLLAADNLHQAARDRAD